MSVRNPLSNALDKPLREGFVRLSNALDMPPPHAGPPPDPRGSSVITKGRFIRPFAVLGSMEIARRSP